MVDDELGARLRGVVEQALEGEVVLDRAGAEVVGGVEQEPQARGPERRAQAAGVGQRRTALGEHAPRRRVHLHPGEAGGLVGGEDGLVRPGVAMDVQSESLVHACSLAGRAGAGVARR
ncbi:MAG: hypothetical protein QOF04_2235 [Solirubrobacteraceae bacterium]|nr:hypothetical protein [Solirubrobacteraceae bacterium]